MVQGRDIAIMVDE